MSNPEYTYNDLINELTSRGFTEVYIVHKVWDIGPITRLFYYTPRLGEKYSVARTTTGETNTVKMLLEDFNHVESNGASSIPFAMRTTVNASRKRNDEWDGKRSPQHWLDFLICNWENQHDMIKAHIVKPFLSPERLSLLTQQKYLTQNPDVEFEIATAPSKEFEIKLDDNDAVMCKLLERAR